MIQRIQSVWLFLAAMLCGLLFIMKLYAVDVPSLMGIAHQPYGVRDAGHVGLFIMAGIITVLPLVAIFFYGNRARQKGLVWLSILGVLGFMMMALMKITGVEAQNPGPQVTYSFGLLVPVVALIFMILAVAGIRKDEKLIKSLDRLR